MPVNGLMVTLSSDPGRTSRTLDLIAGRAGITVGELHDRWLSVVTESSDDRGAKAQHAWLEGLPGVDQVSVIMVAFDETSP